MRATSTGQLFAKTLEGYGVTHIFMVPAMFRAAMVALDDTRIKRVTTHHEMAAAYMADGYARASRKPGICMGQAIGNGNFAAGLRDAYMACSPIIAISGGPHPDYRYRYVYQIVEDISMFDPVTKFNAKIDKASLLPELLRQAFRSATTGTPGPVHLEIPGRTGEVIDAKGDFEVIIEENFKSYPAFRPTADQSSLREAARLLTSAERPVIVAGAGVVSSGAAAELVALAEKLSIPVATSANGKEILVDGHPLSIGVAGGYGRASVNQILGEADLVFFVGTRAGSLVTSNWTTPRPGVPVIQLDIEPSEIGRVYSASLGFVGDAKATLTQLTEAIGASRSGGAWLRHAQELLGKWRSEVESLATSDASPMRPERLCREISEALPADAVVVSDTGHSAIWSSTMIELRKQGQRYIRCAGTLGWAFPGSMGVKCALPDRPVVCFTGDGGFLYHLAELETAARAGINTVVVVNDNHALQQVIRGFDTAYGGKHSQAGEEMWMFKQVDLARVAQDMGCLGIRVERPGDIKPALETALNAGRPAVIDVVTDVEATPGMGRDIICFRF